MSENKKEKISFKEVLNSSVVTALITIVFGSIVARYFVYVLEQNSKENQIVIQRQEALIKNQLDILEKLNEIVVDYEIGARFVLYDVMERQNVFDNSTFWPERIAQFDIASKVLVRESSKELFRIRVYFDGCTGLVESFEELFSQLYSIDAKIAKAITLCSDNKLDDETIKELNHCKEDLITLCIELKKLLNTLIQRAITKQNPQES